MRRGRNVATRQPAASILDVAEQSYRDRGRELCERAGLTSDDFRMRMAGKCQTARILVWREIEREGRT